MAAGLEIVLWLVNSRYSADAMLLGLITIISFVFVIIIIIIIIMATSPSCSRKERFHWLVPTLKKSRSSETLHLLSPTILWCHHLSQLLLAVNASSFSLIKKHWGGGGAHSLWRGKLEMCFLSYRCAVNTTRTKIWVWMSRLKNDVKCNIKQVEATISRTLTCQ